MSQQPTMKHFSAAMPIIASSCVARDNILDSIDNLFERGNELVVLEDAEGTGKTTLLGSHTTHQR